MTAPGGLAVKARITRKVPLRDAPAVAGGWDLKRELFLLDPKTGKRTPVTGPVKVGDLVYVRLSFRPERRRMKWWSSSYYTLEDQVPAGFVVVEEDRRYDGAPFQLDMHRAYARREIGADTVRWFFSFRRGWMDRAEQVGYVMRASFPGDFEGGVARIEEFYDESQVSRTASLRVGVAARPERPGR